VGGKKRRGKVLCSGKTYGAEVKQDGKKETLSVVRIGRLNSRGYSAGHRD